MNSYEPIDKITSDLDKKDIRFEATCEDLLYNDGGLVFPARYTGLVRLANDQEVIVGAYKHIMGGFNEFNKFLLGLKFLEASGLTNTPVTILGKFKQKKNTLKVDSVIYNHRPYDDLPLRLREYIIDLEEMISDFEFKR